LKQNSQITIKYDLYKIDKKQKKKKLKVEKMILKVFRILKKPKIT